jgi:hypothetical protein
MTHAKAKVPRHSSVIYIFRKRDISLYRVCHLMRVVEPKKHQNTKTSDALAAKQSTVVLLTRRIRRGKPLSAKCALQKKSVAVPLTGMRASS